MVSIQSYREKLKMTQVQLAAMLGVSQSAVANWENGIRTPDVFTLKKISEVLHCTVDDLLEHNTIETRKEE